MDELGRDWLREAAGNFGEEGFAFNVAVLAEAGGDGIEAGVVVAGVADELPCAFG